MQMEMNMRTENERQEALHTFNKMADYYDRYRPDYPEVLIQTIINTARLAAGSKLLEIGAGSGKATAQLADFGFEMVCIEPGADLAERGNERFGGRSIRFIVSRFEDYQEPPAYFDAIISAQAFHWVSQPVGYEKCANALKPGGCLAIFWHIDVYGETAADQDLVTVLSKYGGFVACMPEKDYAARIESITSKMNASALFSKPELIHFYEDKLFTADEYFGYMMTGPLAERTDAEKQECCKDLVQLAEKYNGIKRRFTYELYVAWKL